MFGGMNEIGRCYVMGMKWKRTYCYENLKAIIFNIDYYKTKTSGEG
jgi:hypothetical protein